MAQVGDDAEFEATPDETVENWTGAYMAIDLTEEANNPVKFVNPNDTAPSGATKTGFGLYGGWAFHKDGDGPVAMNFLASPTNETGIYL